MSELASELTERRPGWWRKLLGPGRFAVFLVILLLAAAAGYLGARAITLSRQATELATEREQALDAASRYGVDLTTYDYRDLNAAFTAVAADSTPDYAGRYRTASAGTAAQLRSDHSVSSGTVVAVGLENLAQGRKATALVLVNQSIVNSRNTTPKIQRSELRITLARSGGRWLISDLVLL